ncbi:MAG: hypothetical protein RO257_09600 [Candidatus Kapabacteria bacterium]|nr:hypothetical protein [Candidatus Kapabacteria bacterium]
MFKKDYLKIAILTMVIFLTAREFSVAQIGTKVNFGLGLISTGIVGDNRAKLPMATTSTDEDAFTGGSFKYTQPGIQARLTFPINNYEDFRFISTFEYTFFVGRERFGYDNVTVLFSNKLNLMSFGFGLEYVWANLDFANAKLYTGVDVKANYIYKIYSDRYIKYLDNYIEPDLLIYDAKEDALRFGGNIKLGVEGRLRQNFHVNTGFSLGLVNLIGRDDSRGELMTPSTDFENHESFLPVLQVFVLVQYNI